MIYGISTMNDLCEYYEDVNNVLNDEEKQNMNYLWLVKEILIDIIIILIEGVM